jgi:hypothetical protein
MKASISSSGNRSLHIALLYLLFLAFPNQHACASHCLSDHNSNTTLCKATNFVGTKTDIINMDTIQTIQKHMTLVHDVNVETTPDRIWDFLINIDRNYSAWHPADHILFQWTKGEPFSAGSTFYAEQYMTGEKVKYNGRITESIPGERITMKFSFPLSLITDKIEMIIEDHGSHCTFKHVTHMKFKLLSRTIFKKQNIRTLIDMDAHIRTEGGNMKSILEKAR